MEQIKKNSRPISLREFEVKNEFWKNEMEMAHIRIAEHDFPAIRAKAKRRKPVVANQLYTAYQKPEYEDAELLLIPYYAWANRGENEMCVWLNVHES